MTLAVATNDPNAIAETYVRQHMSLIRPGETIGVALSCSSPPIVDVPLLCVRRAGERSGKLGTLGRMIRTGYGAALSKAEEKRLAEFLARHGAEAVLAEFGTTGCALRLLCKRLGLPLFVNFHGHDATVLGRRPDIRRAYGLLARDARGIFCGTKHFAEILQRLGFPAEKITVIPCGIEVSEFDAASEKDRDLVIAVGRLTRKKRMDLTVRAFATASATCPSLRLTIIGDGPERATVEKVIADLDLAEKVTLRGACAHAEVKQALSAAFIFVQHSITAENGDQESQGISLIEAMAAGAAVVVTDHNGFGETVIQGETGLLSPENDIEAMAANIVALSNDPVRADRIRREARLRVEREFDASLLSRKLRTAMFGPQSTVDGSAESFEEVRA